MLAGWSTALDGGADAQIDDDRAGPVSSPAERELLAAALDREVPTLGVGPGRPAARAWPAGGDVYARADLCLGWEPIEFAARDAFVCDIHPRPLVFSWRSHTCRLPDDALLLADSDAEPQIFRLGEVAWGVQFHPEVDRPLLRRLVRQPSRADRRDVPGRLEARCAR